MFKDFAYLLSLMYLNIHLNLVYLLVLMKGFFVESACSIRL